MSEIVNVVWNISPQAIFFFGALLVIVIITLVKG